MVCCARCGHACAVEVWRSTPPERTLTEQELATCVSRWPVDARVEVRACRGCGSPVARRTRAA
jgi:hypothetical protein